MNYPHLVKAIGSASQQLQARAVTAVNQALVLRNWMVGAYIVEYEQNGEDRAKYGAQLLERLAGDLAKRKLKGLDSRSLRDCRRFYRLYPQIRGSLTREFQSQRFFPGMDELAGQTLKSAQQVHPEFTLSRAGRRIRGSVTPKLLEPPILSNSATSGGGMNQIVPGQSAPVTPLSPELVLRFSWTSLVEIIRVDDPLKRAFYENEYLKGNWSVRQLQRQIGSLLYERTVLSKNKTTVVRRAHRQEPSETIADLIRDPYVLEFTGLAALPEYTESVLEKSLLDHLQKFLLELGAGFLFESRQRRITVGNEHDYIDLVFYHRHLRCHVLLDLKTRPFRHGDAGQMNFYLNWWRKNITAEDEQPPVGIILCSDKDQTKVEYATAGMDKRLFVSRYLTALPSPDQLREFLEKDRDQIEALIPERVNHKNANTKEKRKRIRKPA